MRAALALLLCAVALQANARGAHTPTPHGAAVYMARYSTTPHARRPNVASYNRAAHVAALKTCNPFAGVTSSKALNNCL